VPGRAAAQRQLIQRDIQKICSYAVAANKLKVKTAASAHLLAAWRRLVETMFSLAPSNILSNDYRQELLIDTLYNLLYKVLSSNKVSAEIASISSEVLLMLLVDLRMAQIVEGKEMASHGNDPREVSLRGFGGDPQPVDRDPTSGDLNIMLSTIQANASTLKNILCGILQWIVSSSSVSHKLRTNLYGSLLNFLYTTCLVDYEGIEGHGLDSSPRATDNTIAEQRNLVLRVISGFSEGLADALAHDGTGGHDLTCMLALSCLEVLMRLDPSPAWRNFLSDRGYLQLLVDGLLTVDDALVDMCTGDRVKNLRPVYIYECKLALLTRIASTREGAMLLVEQRAPGVLSAMKVFDLIPKIPASQIDDFLPSPAEKFHQVSSYLPVKLIIVL